MILHDGFYWISILPKEMRADDRGEEYRKRRREFVASKEEFLRFAGADRHIGMSIAAKNVLGYLVRCLNFNTGRCDPSQQTIADECGIGLRTVERAIRTLVEAGWIEIYRRNRTASNSYRLRVSFDRVEAIREDLGERKKLREEIRQQRAAKQNKIDAPENPGQTTRLSGGSRPATLTVPDPPKRGVKQLKGTTEYEPLNKNYINQSGGYSRREIGEQALDIVTAPAADSALAPANVIDLVPIIRRANEATPTLPNDVQEGIA